MCGISGALNLSQSKISRLKKNVEVMNLLQHHRGPDGEGIWIHPKENVGFGHKRLAIIDLQSGKQPMSNEAGCTITFNGEIYNYIELRKELQSDYSFRTHSDTEVILAAYLKWGVDCLKHFRGMFAFALWDEKNKRLFCGRDQFGIKPFYYTIVEDTLYFASEIKALLPFIPKLEIEDTALRDYLTFQLYLGHKTPFKGVNELKAAHYLLVDNGKLNFNKYWEVYYTQDWTRSHKYFQENLRSLIDESIDLHLRSDVPLGAYVSGGIDSSSIAALAKRHTGKDVCAFIGKFANEGELFDESAYARSVCKMHGMELHERNITSVDFQNKIEKVIYHLDFPVAGPGSFPQYCVSELASKHRKVVLGGQGGDEIFGGYTRYLLAYFEQCIKGAIEGTLNNGNFVVSYNSIIPNLGALANYKPMIKDFFSKGLFGPMDSRYFQLINRSPSLGEEINWNEFSQYEPFESFKKIFNGENVGKESYFDKMTHFDFKTLLPGLLQVEDRMSMAHGIESRVPLIEPKIVEFAATMPADIKFKDGTLKLIYTNAVKDLLPQDILDRKNKMGFPVPLNQWMKGDLKSFVFDIMSSKAAKERRYISNKRVMEEIDNQSQFDRKIWGLLSLEIWQREFFDKHHKFKELLNT
jgi:asparagine synthase (glutamine-hydrolysing)